MRTITIVTKLIDKLKEEGQPVTDELQTKIDTLYLVGRLTDEDYMTVCDKQGYRLVKTGENVFELVKDEESAAPAGDYLNPISWVEGIEVEAGKFYAFADGNIWEAVKSGVAEYNSEWFEIIT